MSHHRVYVACMRPGRVVLATALAMTMMSPALAATAGGNARVKVRCTVPRSQPERLLAPNSCLNYIPDGTQTFTAHVRDGNGDPVAGVWVQWSDSDNGDAHFRFAQNPCRTGSNGACSAELVDTHPRAGEKITVTASVAGSSANGYLSFR